MRRLPHGSARGGRRAAGPAVSGHARTRGDRHRRGDRRGRRPAPGRPPRRRRLAGLDLRRCAFCLTGRENLCDAAAFTGYTRDGGFASHMLAETAYVSAAAGRSGRIHGAVDVRRPDWLAQRWRLATPAAWAFGSAGQALAQICAWQHRRLHAYTRPGDASPSCTRARWARPGPATAASTRRNPWTRPSSSRPSASLYPWPCGPSAGVDVRGGIHMTDIPAFPYRLLWGERKLVSVVNLTRADAREFGAGPGGGHTLRRPDLSARTGQRRPG